MEETKTQRNNNNNKDSMKTARWIYLTTKHDESPGCSIIQNCTDKIYIYTQVCNLMLYAQSTSMVISGWIYTSKIELRQHKLQWPQQFGLGHLWG